MMRVRLFHGEPHADRRGVIYELGSAAFRHKAVLVTKKGSVRGNHFHKRRGVETFFVAKGRARFVVENVATKKRGSFLLKQGQGIAIPDGFAHAVVALSDCVFVEFSKGAYRKSDSIEYVVHEKR
jgi:cupin fold WbuC family metalloprotein